MSYLFQVWYTARQLCGIILLVPPVFPHSWWNMMASSNGNIFSVTGPLCGEFTSHRWTNGSANNRDAGDLRRHRVLYNVTVMNLSQCQYKALGNTYKTPREPLTNFYDQPSLRSSPGQPSFLAVLISTIAPKRQCGAFLLITFSCEPSLYANYHLIQKMSIVPTNIPPVILENIVLFSGLGFSRREMWRIIGVSQGAI